MRMTGALLTAVALCLAGGYAARMLTLRVSLLEKICVMLRIVRTQFECCCCPVGDVLEILSSTPELKELVFIPECERLCLSEPFPQAWSDSLSRGKIPSAWARPMSRVWSPSDVRSALPRSRVSLQTAICLYPTSNCVCQGRGRRKRNTQRFCRLSERSQARSS